MSISDASISGFEAALRARAATLPDEQDARVDELERLLNEVASSGLNPDEKYRRGARLAEYFAGDDGIIGALAAAARRADPVVKGGVLGRLSPEQRVAVYRDAGPDEQPITPPAPVSADDSLTDVEGHDDEASRDEWRTILLLGNSQDVEKNERFLQSTRYRPIRVSTERELAALTQECYSAVIVHASFLRAIAEDQDQANFFVEQLRRSNVVVYRIESSGLRNAEAFVAKVEGLGPDVRSRITIADGATINCADLVAVDRYAQLLESTAGASVSLDGVTAAETRLLTGASALFLAKLRGAPVPTRAATVQITPIAGGRSGARVLRVGVPGSGFAFVAKFDDMENLANEMGTARRVMPSTQALDMEIYALNGATVLLQRLVADADRPSEIAPSFKERLDAQLAWERGRRRDPSPDCSDLQQAVNRLLAALDSMRSGNLDGLEDSCWTTNEPLDALADVGAVWQIESDVGEFDPRQLLPAIEARIGGLAGTGIVHGDLHAGNVLMSDDRTPVLIDFASAGRGHPVFDYVRFGLAVGFSAIRPLVPEARLRLLFGRIFIEGCGPTPVITEFDDLSSAPSAALAIECLCAVRSAGMATLAGRVEDPDFEIIAMTYLVAAQSLNIADFEVSTVRAALGAIHPVLSARLAT